MATFTVNTHHAYLNNDIVIKTEGQITIEDTITGLKYEFQNELKTHLSAGRHILKSSEHEEEIFIEDAIKLGGSRIKNAFVFDDSPWVFVTTKDRLYISNIETQRKKETWPLADFARVNGIPWWEEVSWEGETFLLLTFPKRVKKGDKDVALSAHLGRSLAGMTPEGIEELGLDKLSVSLLTSGNYSLHKSSEMANSNFTTCHLFNERVEYNITPKEIISLPCYVDKTPNEFFLFKTYDKTYEDCAIYNVLTGKVVIRFSNHIFSNEHLVIFKQEDGIEVYDFRLEETVVHFNGQCTLEKQQNKLYYIKDNLLYGLNLRTSQMNTIPYVGNVNDSDLLLENHLLKLNDVTSYRKYYTYYSLGDGEHEISMSKMKLALPYYIESWLGHKMSHFGIAKENYCKFDEEYRKNLRLFPDVHCMCLGMKVTHQTYYWESEKRIVKFHGEIIAYPINKLVSIPFIVEGDEKETIDFAKYTIELPNSSESGKDFGSSNSSIASLSRDFPISAGIPADTISISHTPAFTNTNPDISAETFNISCTLDKGEKKIGQSSSGRLLLTQNEEGIFLRNIEKNERYRILQTLFDSTNYANAYFTSDGKRVFLRINDTEARVLGLDDLATEPFVVEGFTLSKNDGYRNDGYNGYMPEISLSKGGRIPIWRDPITLGLIKEKDMSSHVFKSPNGEYIAENQKRTIIYNRLTKTEMSPKDVRELESKYDWTFNTSEEEKKTIVERRKKLVEQSDKDDLFGKLIEQYSGMFPDIKDEDERRKKCDEFINKEIESYISKYADFTSLIIDDLGFVCYRKNKEDAEEKQILIGRSVWYLNYVSFSYDSKYLSFAAKLGSDKFRSSQAGVFGLFDLEKEEFVCRIDNHSSLWAVWMTMFSKNGDVAFYDSRSTAYLLHKSDNYNSPETAPGKSLLCFSPSGKYIAFSDQNYIDFTHHPDSNWGHQPSGNVFIHAVDDFDQCLEQYNDMGDGISGVAQRAGNVSSAAFSQDETKLLVVGNDGVVVVRNLKSTK